MTTLTFDKNTFSSNREIDDNGYLRVEGCNITKTQVAPYLGREIPGWKEMGLDSNEIYYVLRPEEELKKAAPTFNNLPLTREHIEVDVENVPKEKIVGSLGDHTQYADGYLKNNLIIYDKKDIDLVMSGKKKELSCGYRYTPVRQHGIFDGKPYDFIMTNIIGNHVALVKEGRAGHDVVVRDTINTIKESIMNIFKKKEITNDEIPQEEVKPQEAGEEIADKQGEVEMTEEVKETPVEAVEEVKVEAPAEQPAEQPAEAETPAEAPVVEDAKEKDLEGKEKKAFAEGVKYGEKKEKEEPKKLDSEHESEGAKKADEKKAEEKKEAEDEEKKEDKKAEDKCAKDKCTKDEKPAEMAMDIDAIKAEVRQEVLADFKAREEARQSVRSVVGDVNVMTFDSAEDIYKFACEKAGMNLNEIASYKSAFVGFKSAKGKLAMDASSVGSNKECFKDIRLA